MVRIRRMFIVGVGLAALVLLASVAVYGKQEDPQMATSVFDKAKQVTPGTAYSPYAVPAQYGASTGANAINTVGQAAMDTQPSYYEDPGTGYDMGAAVAPAPRMLASSPEWLAYLNALGLEEQQARADVDKQRGLYQSDATRQLQDLPAGYMQQRRGITGSMESRGMARSGEMLRRLAENRANQGRAEANVNAQLGFQLGNLESSLANKLIQLNSARAQQEMNLRAQGYQ